MACIVLLSGCSAASTVPDTPTLPEEDDATEITIEVFDVTDFYMNAALRFEGQTGIKVNVINHYSAEQAIDDQDYAYENRIPGELMAGRGADIYANVFIDFTAIGDQGYLCNLADWIAADPDFSDEKYYMNIIKTGFDGGDVYSFPLFMMFLGFGSDVEVPELDDKNLNWEEFFELTKNINRNGVLISLTDYQIFIRRFRDRFDSFIDKENKTENLNTPELVHLLKQSKEWSEQGLCIPYSADNDTSMFYNAFIKEYGSGIEVLANIRFPGSTFYSSAGDTISGGSTYWYDIPSDSGKYDKSNKLLTRDHICVNAASPYKGTAWKFIKFLLQKDIQLNSYSTPVNREAAAIDISRNLNSSISSVAQNNDAEQAIKETELILDAIEDSPNRYRRTGIENILLKEAKRYFSNEISAEAAVENMSDAVKLYFKEQ